MMSILRNKTHPLTTGSSLHLPCFWSDIPASWFAHAETCFHLHGVTTEALKFGHLMAALPHDCMKNLNKDTSTPYTELKNCLLAVHELTHFQRIDRLFHMEPMGDRKPSEFLAQMTEICPQGEEKSIFFMFLFLQYLPRELQVLLGEYDKTDAGELAAKADVLWATLSHCQHSTTVGMKSEEESAPRNKGESLLSTYFWNEGCYHLRRIKNAGCNSKGS
jgi:hypothetical protein